MFESYFYFPGIPRFTLTKNLAVFQITQLT